MLQQLVILEAGLEKRKNRDISQEMYAWVALVAWALHPHCSACGGGWSVNFDPNFIGLNRVPLGLDATTHGNKPEALPPQMVSVEIRRTMTE
jgi:hypothetical protein